MMDSVTRFAMAQREIGLAVGEPPATRGYTPSVFSLLPQLLERAGSGEIGSITGLFTVLVEADDMNDPIADAVRSILDGHVVLTRELATQNHYPAIDVLESVSRLTRDLTTPDQQKLTARAREALANYRKNQDLINIGAYPAGTNPAIDLSIHLHEPMKAFLCQGIEQGFTTEQSWAALTQTMSTPMPAKAAAGQTPMKAFRFTLEAVRTLRQRQEHEALEHYARALLARQQVLDLRWRPIDQRIGRDFAQMRNCWPEAAPPRKPPKPRITIVRWKRSARNAWPRWDRPSAGSMPLPKPCSPRASSGRLWMSIVKNNKPFINGWKCARNKKPWMNSPSAG
jgi:hypothetical protein